MYLAPAPNFLVKFERLDNMCARRPRRKPDLPPIAIGSHLDTQPHGGRFDGVMACLEAESSLNDHSIDTEAPIEVDLCGQNPSRFV